MTRSISAVTENASNQEATRPIYLIEIENWSATSPLQTTRICTWDVNISWDSQTWVASGAEIPRIGINGGTLHLPNGDDDPWLGIVGSCGTRDITVTVYEHHTYTGSPMGSDAEQVFTGVMDGDELTERGFSIALVEGKRNKGFPPTSINRTEYNYLLPKGKRIFWVSDIVNVN
jgi:hypothetical protein